ncbi:MAG: cytochrome c family protein [Thermoguttaceae bacterium]|nr:cytochrome c family protein [Thermoguttaceae bacterium]
MGGSLIPQWIDRARPLVGLLIVGVPLYLVGLFYYGASPKTIDVGYMPDQPVPFSHALHAGKLGMDCRYCHTTVERAAHAALPSTEVCMNCHARIGVNLPSLSPVRQSYAEGTPVPWIRVHDLPDFVYFDHSAHISRGVSCVSCHGRVDRMEKVYQAEPLRMGWCIECHRNPEPHLRPVEFVTDLDWVPPENPVELGKRLRKENNINPSTDCWTCHR